MQRALLLWVGLVAAACCAPAHGRPALVDEREAALVKLASELSSIYASRCAHISAAPCSYSAYSSALNGTCLHSDLVVDEGTCGKCTGALGDLGHSSVRRAPATSEAQRAAADEDVAWTALAEGALAAAYDPATTLAVRFTTASGVTRAYPGAAAAANNTDERLTATYAATLSGPKCVQVLLDRSSSMSYDGVWGKAKAVAAAMLGLLGPRDHAALSVFSNEAETLAEGPDLGLSRATPDALWALESDYCRMAASGGSLYRAGLRRAYGAFDLFARRSPGAARCPRVLLLVTDGENRERVRDLYPLLARLQGASAVPPRVYTYSLTRWSKEGRLRALSCYTGGAHVQVVGGSQATTDHLSLWNDHLALDARAALAAAGRAYAPAWSALLPLSSGASSGTATVAVPVFAGPLPTSRLLGVVSLDVVVRGADAANASAWDEAVVLAAADAVAEAREAAPQCDPLAQAQAFRRAHPGATGGECGPDDTPERWFGRPPLPLGPANATRCAPTWAGDGAPQLCAGLNASALLCPARANASASYADRVCCAQAAGQGPCQGVVAGRTAAEKLYVAKCAGAALVPLGWLLALALLGMMRC
eukprot:m51a1_g5368 putative C-tail anchored protein (593) ;mRNA; r:521354-523321